MALDEYLRLGRTVTLGSHTFTADEIKRFAVKYDPQRFHVDEEAARGTIFGKLCASGWHTAATWMRLNLAARPCEADWKGPGPVPVFGPSPGFTNLKWPKPVYAGETITFTNQALSHRALASRPGWRILFSLSEAFDSGSDRVLAFDSAVLFKVE